MLKLGQDVIIYDTPTYGGQLPPTKVSGLQTII